jgi:hypothetical protein
VLTEPRVSQAAGAAFTQAQRFQALPIVIGVTGHRDIAPDAESALRERFDAILARFESAYPNSPLLVLSGLAAGADLIAAEVALERTRRVSVKACLPMPAQEYESDFTPEQRDRFRAALAQCERSGGVQVLGASTDRTASYAAVGVFLAYYSTVLVAFWDGEEGRGAGGTADVVRLREDPPAAKEHFLTYMPDTGPIFHIITPREGQVPPPGAFEVKEIYPKRRSLNLDAAGKRANRRRLSTRPAQEEFEEALRNIDRFNCDLESEPQAAGDPLHSFFVRIDELANKLQKHAMRSLTAQYAWAAAAAVAQVALAFPVGFHVARVPVPPALGTAVKILLLIVAALAFKQAKTRDYENRYQDYRAISEALRVQDAWCCAGLRSNLVESSYLQMQQSELQWIRLALRTIFLVTSARAPQREDSLTHPQCAEWVNEQLDFYEGAARREHDKQRKWSKTSSVLMSAGGALTGLAVFFGLLLGKGGLHVPVPPIDAALTALTAWLHAHIDPATLRSWTTPGGWFQYWQAVPIAASGALALLIRFYTQQRGFKENMRRYEHMYVVFDTASSALRREGNDAPEILLRLGREALAEHAQWLILHRERPLQFVSA